MIVFSNLSLQRGRKTLFEQVSVTIHPGDKVGVVGRNGTGKSSLLALLRGDLQPDSGELTRPPGLRIAHAAQETPALARAAIDFVIDGDSALREVEAALAATPANEGDRLARLHAELDSLDGYTAKARAARLLHGLGFTDPDLERPVSEFSGGWRVRLNLAQALMCPSDLLLLDEPTNHLDLDAVIWLEQWLRLYTGTLLLISHDRDFLDNVTNRIAYLDGRGISPYRGNYSAFERLHAADLAHRQAMHAKQQRETQRIRAFVDRFRAKATKARQAQSRLKALERMDEIAAAHVDTPFRFAFPESGRIPNPLLKIEGASAGYGARPVLQGLRLNLQPGMRVGLVGHNGAGKSTLIKLLAGEIAPREGEYLPGNGLRIGYFAQHQLEQLDAGAGPLLHLQRLAPDAAEQELRDFLGGFDFRGDRVEEPVERFSGGEKARLVLALLVWKAPNLLLLDEPTNHLDLEMRHALEMALQDFGGVMVLVSHDRHLIRATTDELLLVAAGTAQPFDGDLDDYRDWLGRAQSPEDTGPKSVVEHSAAERKAQRRTEARQRQRLQPLVKEIRRLEQRMEALDGKRQELESMLADPGLYEAERKEELKSHLVAQARNREQLEQAESEWLELSERLESPAQ